MTAKRWWVKHFARWQARVDSVQGQIQAVSLVVTAFSTFSLVLQNAGLGEFVPYLGVAIAIALPVYAYYFFEGGVWNQVSRDRVDMSSNYSGPSMRIDDELIGAAVFAAVHQRPPNEEEHAAIAEAVDGPWREYRDGIPEEELK